jgi:hypothetical protein
LFYKDKYAAPLKLARDLLITLRPGPRPNL